MSIEVTCTSVLLISICCIALLLLHVLQSVKTEVSDTARELESSARRSTVVGGDEGDDDDWGYAWTFCGGGGGGVTKRRQYEVPEELQALCVGVAEGKLRNTSSSASSFEDMEVVSFLSLSISLSLSLSLSMLLFASHIQTQYVYCI